MADSDVNFYDCPHMFMNVYGFPNCMRMIVCIFLIVIIASMVTANGEGSHDEPGHDEMESMASHDMSYSGSSFSHQVQMVLPFSHFGEGHWFAGVVLSILWIVLILSIVKMWKL
jgi:hypothetical protein